MCWARPPTGPSTRAISCMASCSSWPGAYALARNAHVRGDFLYRAWQPADPGGDGPGPLLPVLLPRHHRLHLFGLWLCRTILVHVTSIRPTALSGPPIYHYKTIIPVTGVLLLLQGIVEVVRCLICLTTGGWPRRLHDVEELEKVILEQRAAREANP